MIFQAPVLRQLAAEIDRASGPKLGLSSDAVADDVPYAADAQALAETLPSFDQGSPKKIRTVLLTGATGFLGSYLLRELLDGTAHVDRVWVLARNTEPAAGLARLEAISRQYQLWSAAWTDRIEVVPADLAEPELGVGSLMWKRLKHEVDLVIHNGAWVHWMVPYSSLRAVNVLSTLACLQLCVGRPKRLVFVSSTSTLDSELYANQTVLESDTLERSRKRLTTGYGQSKWASEYLVRAAYQRGLSAIVVRPGYVVGDSILDVSITDDFLVRLWKACVQVGSRPDIKSHLNAMPVRQVSRIVVAAALHSKQEVVQITASPCSNFNTWIGALEVYGFDVAMITYTEWCARVKQYVAGQAREQFALLPLFDFVTEELPAKTQSPILDDRNARKRSQSTIQPNPQQMQPSRSTCSVGT